MSGPFAHPWLGGLFADAEAAAIWSPEADLGRMIAFEAAWSRALGSEAAARGVEGWTPDMEALRAGTAQDGLPVPALARALKAAAGANAEDVHTGATSQDVMDSSLAMALRDTVDLLDARLIELGAALTALAGRFGDVEIMGRTRMQDALPIEARSRIEAWARPLARHRARLEQLRPRVAVVQIGGPVGDRRNITEAQVGAVAGALGLAPGPCWHTARDGVAEAGALFAAIAGSAGKIGQDLALMAQMREVRLAGGGGSSAMPHKQNPVAAETLVTLARYTAAQSAALQTALVHEQDRSGAAWTLEWMTMPDLAKAAVKSAGLAKEVIRRVEQIGG